MDSPYNLVVLLGDVHRPGERRITVSGNSLRIIQDVGNNISKTTILYHVGAAADWDYEVAHVVVEK